MNDQEEAAKPERSVPDVAEFKRIQDFAETALDEVARRAADDGMDQEILHTAFCIASVSYLRNQYGPDRALAFLSHLMKQIRDQSPPSH